MTTQLQTLLDNILTELDTAIESDTDARLNNKNSNIVKSFPTNNINIRWNNLIDECCLQCRDKHTIHWTKCNHKYCRACILNIIKEHLSLKNEIPQCPECNQLLTIQTVTQHKLFRSSYPIKYKLTLTFKKYFNMTKLIHGYIRRIKTVPNEVILIIFDFYHLNYFKPIYNINCNKCIQKRHFIPYSPLIPFKSHMSLLEASKLKINDKIDHRDNWHDWTGKFVEATIIDKKGTNLKIHYHTLNLCDKWDVWSDYYEELYRFAKHESITKRPANRFKILQKGSYIDIYPMYKHLGWKPAAIQKMDRLSGQIQVAYKHDNNCYNYWTHLDNQHEIAPFRSRTMSQTECNSCILALDFRQICNKQKLCIICNKFYPLDSIMFWSNCKHVLCFECLMKHAKNEITQNKIPICPAKNCYNEIAPNEYEYQHNIVILLDLWRESYKNKPYTIQIGPRLRLLLSRKDKFECGICNTWHSNILLFTQKNNNCQHKYSIECYTNLQLESNCGHSDCLMCLTQCEICQTFDENKNLMAWTKCHHKYHKKCVKKYINEWILPKQSMFSKLLNNNDMIPLCVHKNCNELLDINCAELSAIGEYQCNVLYQMRKQSLLINDSDKCIRYKYEAVNDDDFATVSPIKVNK